MDISGYYIDDGNEVSVQGVGVGFLKSGGYWGFKCFRFLDEPLSTYFDISSKFEISWEKGSLLEVLITNGGGHFGDGFFKIKESVFTLEYEKAPLAHSPEPSTMILLGLGLVAVGFVWRKSIKKD
ncbi:MAG: PEP-CTERM sorting domain-containing protein [Desulfobacteraceae bacterium]|nr:PEP-CTERM sorting domain-containing protein [Desulfobacteraceae bacterium]